MSKVEEAYKEIENILGSDYILASRPEIDPENQDISFVIEGEVPSPIAPPPGCTFNPRCISDARTSECEHDLPHKIKIEENHFIWCVNPPIMEEN